MKRTRYPAALATYLRAYKIAERRKDLHTLSRLNTNMGHLHRRLGDIERSLAHHAKAVEIERRRKDRVGLVDALGSLGAAQLDNGEYDAAIATISEALERNEAMGRTTGNGGWLHNIGLSHHRAGRYSDALSFFERALDAKKKTGNPVRQATTWNVITTSRLRLGKLDEAMEASKKALALLGDIDNPATRVHAMLGLARVHLARSDAKASYAAAKDALDRVGRLVGGLADQQAASARDTWTGLLKVATEAATGVGDPAALHHVLEAGSAGALREALGARGALRRAVVPAELSRRLDEAHAKERNARKALRLARTKRNLREVRSAKKSLAKGTERRASGGGRHTARCQARGGRGSRCARHARDRPCAARSRHGTRPVRAHDERGRRSGGAQGRCPHRPPRSGTRHCCSTRIRRSRPTRSRRWARSSPSRSDSRHRFGAS